MRIAIISPNKSSYSETFIKAHLDYLKGEKYFLYGSYLPLYYNEKSLVLSVPAWKRIILKLFSNEDLLTYAIKNFLAAKRVEIILAEYGPTGCAILDIARELRLPLVVHFHGYDASSSGLLKEYSAKYKLLFAYSSKIIAVSEKMCSDLQALGADRSRLIVNPCGPDKRFLDINPDYQGSQNLLFIGRFVSKKAPYLLIEVLRKVVAVNPNLKLVMVGDGVLLDTCKVLADIHGLKNSVVFKGLVSHHDLAELMTNSFCYVQHSITTEDGETEGTPVAIMEASLAGLPVVSTIHGGIPDVIENGGTGYLVNEKDTISMAEYIILLDKEREMAKRMGMKGKNRIKDKYLLDKHIGILNSVISQAISEY